MIENRKWVDGFNLLEEFFSRDPFNRFFSCAPDIGHENDISLFKRCHKIFPAVSDTGVAMGLEKNNESFLADRLPNSL